MRMVFICVWRKKIYSAVMKIVNMHVTLLDFFCVLHQKIRRAAEPDNPKLIHQFLNYRLVATMMDREAYREQLVSQFQLLLETIADECLPAHWRCQCLDNIYRPIYNVKTYCRL